MECKVVPGGGATELAVANFLNNQAKYIQGEEQFPYKAVAKVIFISNANKSKPFCYKI
jgi:T-complex protein 1 subunit gamma